MSIYLSFMLRDGTTRCLPSRQACYLSLKSSAFKNKNVQAVSSYTLGLEEGLHLKDIDVMYTFWRIPRGQVGNSRKYIDILKNSILKEFLHDIDIDIVKPIPDSIYEVAIKSERATRLSNKILVIKMNNFNNQKYLFILHIMSWFRICQESEVWTNKMVDTIKPVDNKPYKYDILTYYQDSASDILFGDNHLPLQTYINGISDETYTQFLKHIQTQNTRYTAMFDVLKMKFNLRRR